MFGFDLPLWLIGLGGIIKDAARSLFAFFSKPPGIYILAAIILALVWWHDHNRAYDRGYAAAQAEETAKRKDAEIAAYKNGLKVQEDLDKGLAHASLEFGIAAGKAEANTVFLTKEVTKYVTIEIDRGYPVPCGVLKLHDAAAAGASPEALGADFCGPDDAVAPVKASELASVIVANYGAYHLAEAKVTALQKVLLDLIKASGAKLELLDVPANGGRLGANSGNLDSAVNQPVGNADDGHSASDPVPHQMSNDQQPRLVSGAP